MLRVVAEESSGAELVAGLDELAREGARRMLAMALEAEVEAYLAERSRFKLRIGRSRAFRRP